MSGRGGWKSRAGGGGVEEGKAGRRPRQMSDGIKYQVPWTCGLAGMQRASQGMGSIYWVTLIIEMSRIGSSIETEHGPLRAGTDGGLGGAEW